MKTLSPLILVFVTIFMCTANLYATDNPPDPPQADHGGNTDLPPGGGAPLGGGTYVLIALAATYAVYKFKKFRKLTAVIALCLALSLPALSFASDVPNPPAGDHGGSGDIAPGGGAPIGGGTFILLGLAVAYAGKKIYGKGKIELEE
ncbi:MAG: hypothetical protein C0595_07495 [Marinilabiliales bacterium]|nr:MAG: hypothetical protein C0595_07495 [Marinilabiliales bacterium]